MSESIWPLVIAALLSLPFAWMEFVWRDVFSIGVVQRQERGFLSSFGMQRRWRVVAFDGRKSSWRPGEGDWHSPQMDEAFEELKAQRKNGKC